MRKSIKLIGFLLVYLWLLGGQSNLQTAQTERMSESVGYELSQQVQNIEDVAEFETFLDGFVESNMETLQIPGLSFAIVKDGQLFFSKGYGYADVENQIPVEPDKTVFRVGSVSKLVTAVTLMQVVEQGNLDLNTDINQYLSSTQIPDTYPKPVTIKHLLTHTAGFEDRIIGVLAEDKAGIRPLGEFLANYPVERAYPTGAVHSYSNYSFTLAGQLIAEGSGLPFNQYVTENIFQPLEMPYSTFEQPVPQDISSKVAIGYVNTGTGYEVGPDIYLQIGPAGSLSTTAEDMGHFMIAMLANGRYQNIQILQEETAQQVKQQQFTHHADLPGMTMGFKERYINGQRLIGHGGDIDTFASQMILLPEHNIGFFMVYNAFNDAIRQNFINQFMDHYFPAETTSPPPATINLSSEELARFAGSYRWVKYPQSTLAKFSIFPPGAHNWTAAVNDDGTISFAPFALGGEWRYVPVEPLVFKQISGEPLLIGGVQIDPGETLVFRENDAGEITFAFIPLQNAGMEKLAWYEATPIHMMILGLALLSFLSVLIWPIGGLIKRIRKKTVTATSPVSKQAHWLAGGIGITNLIAFILLMINLGPILGIGVPLLMKVALSLFVLTSMLTLGLVVVCILAWMKRYWSIFGRIHYTAITVFAVMFVWWLNYWNLLGWNY